MTDWPDMNEVKNFPRFDEFNVTIECTKKQKIAPMIFGPYRVTVFTEICVRIFFKQSNNVMAGFDNMLLDGDRPPTIEDYRAAYMRALES